MYEIADKYNVLGLKELSQEKFRRGCTAFWKDDVFPIAAHYAYLTIVDEDKGLRDLVIVTLSEYMELIQRAGV